MKRDAIASWSRGETTFDFHPCWCWFSLFAQLAPRQTAVCVHSRRLNTRSAPRVLTADGRDAWRIDGRLQDGKGRVLDLRARTAGWLAVHFHGRSTSYVELRSLKATEAAIRVLSGNTGRAEPYAFSGSRKAEIGSIDQQRNRIRLERKTILERITSLLPRVLQEMEFRGVPGGHSRVRRARSSARAPPALAVTSGARRDVDDLRVEDERSATTGARHGPPRRSHESTAVKTRPILRIRSVERSTRRTSPSTSREMVKKRSSCSRRSATMPSCST